MKMYDVSELDRRITFVETDVETENELGEIELGDRDLCTVWAKVQEIKEKERYRADKIDAERDYEIIIRYKKGIKQTMKIRYQDRILEIISPPVELGRREYLEIMAKEYTTDEDRYENKNKVSNLKVVLGLPASGKTSYVEEVMTDKDLVMDLDKIVMAMTDKDMHDRNNNSKEAVGIANKMMGNFLEDIKNEYDRYENIYYIRVVLANEEKEKLKKLGAKFYLIDTSKKLVESRLLDQGRANLISKIPDWEKWYENNRDLYEVVK